MDLTPERKAESARRLLVLADFLEKLPPGRFDYGRWVGDDWKGAPDLSCGTTACALGWATTIPEFTAMGLYMDNGEGWPSPVVGDKAGEDAGADVFLLSNEEANFLFYGDSAGPGGERSPTEKATATEVAAHIRAFVAKYRT